MPVDPATLILPELPIPYPLIAHPEVDYVRKRTIELIKESELVEDAELLEHRFDFGNLAALNHPFASNPERVAFIGLITHLVTAVDDSYIERSILEGNFTRAAKNLMALHRIADHPCENLKDAPSMLRVWQLICQEFLKRGEEAYARMVSGWRNYTLAQTIETIYWAQRTLPDFATYQPYRYRSTGYGGFGFYLIEFASDLSFPASVWAHPDVRRLDWLCSLAAGYFNDIHSLPSDPYPERMFSLPAVLANEHGWSLQRGIDEAAKIYIDCANELNEVSHGLAQSENEALRHYAKCAPAIAFGFMHWENQATRRYASFHRHTGHQCDGNAALSISESPKMATVRARTTV